MNCAFYISYASGLRTRINFANFDLEYKADYLYIGIGGPDEVGVEDALFIFHGKSGNQETAPEGEVVVESGNVWFLFTSDVDITETGFIFTYNVEGKCSHQQVKSEWNSPPGPQPFPPLPPSSSAIIIWEG